MRLLLAGLAALLLPSSASATRVVVVQSDDLQPYTAPVAPFLEGLGEPADVYNLRGREKDAEALVERLERDPPEVAFALGAKAAWTLKKHTDIPVVYASILSPARFDIVGRNVAGVNMVAPPARSLGQLAAFFPDLRRVAVLRGPSVPDSRILEMKHVAGAAGIELVLVPVDGPKALRSAFSALGDVDAVWVQADRQILDRASYVFVVEEAQRTRIPLIVETENMVRAGGMFAVVPDPKGVAEAALALTETILNGQRPEGEVVYARDVDVVLNVGAVKQSGVPFEALMLDFVDVVVE